jgi:hypothetical protein
MLDENHFMDPTQQSAADYYKKHRKHTLFSRFTIISSMAILLIVLAINISALYSQEKSTTSSHASTPENVEKFLPSLPAGCVYLHENGKVKINCPKEKPTTAASVPINVALPELPPQCSLVTSTSGSVIHCSTVHPPIPTVPVTLPTTCIGVTPDKTVICKNAQGQNETIPLPSLPEGCSYSLVSNQYYVVCEAK